MTTTALCADAPADAEITIEQASAELARAGNVVQPIRARAERRFLTTRQQEGMPLKKLEYEWEMAVRRCAGQDAAHQVHELLCFERWLENFAKRSDLSKLAFEERQAAVIATAAAAGAQLSSMGLAFDAVRQILSWQSRGFAVELDNGAISINPAGALNPVDRDLIRNHRAGIVAALANVEKF
jgi:hypothetical protein